MSKPNHDVSKDVVVDVGFDGEEIELSYEEITNRRLLPKKNVYTLPKEQYKPDHVDRSPKSILYLAKKDGTEKPNEMKNLIGVEYSQFIIRAYKVKVLSDWTVFIPTKENRVCLYQENHFAIYLECFKFRMRIPFNDF